ncbi:hypothetical protein D3C72_1979930 [compost metagenome]
MAPSAYTGRRPILSDSAPNTGTASALHAVPTMMAVSARVDDKCSTVVTYVRVNTTTSAYSTSEPMRTPPAISRRRQ